MSGAYGLPYTVATLLRHMEEHKDLLRWNISGSSGKITLTLSWNFSKQAEEGLWHKLQRILKIKSNDGIIPDNISKILHSIPNSKSSSTSHFRRSQSYRSALSSKASPRGSSPDRQSSADRLTRCRSSSSWHGSLPYSSRSPERSLMSRDSSLSNMSRNESFRSNRVKLVYQSEEEVENKVLEKSTRVQEQAREHLAHIKQDWNDTIKNWDKIIEKEEFGLYQGTDDSASSSSIVNTRDTVAKCLQSCDKILDRHSTLIL